ncbi:mobile mystery protein A [Bradyrhizobium sp. LHD-71]|uniref:mobile mystery protein A n=1 Tax=Bradyrhizobium sp. LHD-71 TaxID=3072141 RepID=UPI00280CD7E9|nr:mobile mystery protein A [Bradyrhizobium sp. LHD-71]MDQ8729476.1 mobile mystery protein A [Bradyrhizobium sp. LHD-71]
MNDAIRHLDKRFVTLRPLANTPLPPRGWLRAIRDALGMTTAQMGRRLQVSQPRIVELEQSEMSGSVTLNTLQRAAEALGCRLVYALVPERPLVDFVHERADLIAARRTKAVAQSMRLEDQEVKSGDAAKQLHRREVERLLNRPARLWDEE